MYLHELYEETWICKNQDLPVEQAIFSSLCKINILKIARSFSINPFAHWSLMLYVLLYLGQNKGAEYVN